MTNIKTKYPHYHQLCPYEVIDPYRIANLYSLNDPVLFHAFKKILLCGHRGYKDQEQDIIEAIDSLNRRLEMWDEDKNLLSCGQSEIKHEEGQVLQGVMCPICDSVVYGNLDDDKWCTSCDWDNTTDIPVPEYKRCEQCED